MVRVRVPGRFCNVRASALCACACMADFASLTFYASLHLYASFFASFDPCLAYSNLRLLANTSRHLMESNRN
ncbi:uncharacterized protein DS421_11g342790 [Arachis hypogaea]|nr:uncharacterized protein DS421_11g342790 [Arachis hypogaea]